MGTNHPSSVARAAWRFLLPYVEPAHRFVFTRRAYVPEALAQRDVDLIAPSIDPAAPKNRRLEPDAATAIALYAGLGTEHEPPTSLGFDRRYAGTGFVRRHAEVLRAGPGPRLGVDPVVLHIARWDRLKDAVGLMRGFAAHVLNEVDAHLIVAGPAIGAVADDPESATVYEEVLGEWRALPDLERSRIQIACLPLDDVDENAMIVNGLLQHASVVVKKSLEEGFGLGATEALWKCKPVVAARVGGLPDQVEHGRTGVLLDDPTDGAALGEAVCELLGDDALARSLGQAGHRRVRERFLIDRHLAEWLELLPDAVRRYSAATRRPARAL